MRWTMKWLVGLVSLGMAVVSMVVFSPPALAAQSEGYVVTRCFHLTGVGVYVQMSATGTLTWTVEKTPVGQRFNNVTVHNPTITVATRDGCGHTAGFITRAKAEITQGFYATYCSANANISAGLPWGVSAAPTYSCNTTDVGSRSTNYGKNNLWSQKNTGAPVYWDGHIWGGYYGSLDPWPCIDMRVAVTIYQGTSTSDSVIWGNNEPLHALSC